MCFVRLLCLPLAFFVGASAHKALIADVVDFDTEVVPIFSKAGCNAAACHGGAAGQAGFRLSLFGGDPDFDYRTVVRDLKGRRVNISKPHASLLLAKPTEAMEHGGGPVLDDDSQAAETIERWIADGARRRRLRSLAAVRVEPQMITFKATPAEFQLRVTAAFDDGTKRDVSSLATYWALDESAITLGDDGLLRVNRAGRQAVMVRFGNQVVPVTITSPLGEFEGDFSADARQNWIDDEILETLRELRLPVSRQADDSVFLRRVYLDLTGRLPTVEQTRAFLEDHRGQKRPRLVRRLIDCDEFIEFWTYRFARILRLRPPANDNAAGNAFYGWLSSQIKADAPWNEMVRSLILAEGDSHQNGAAAFHRLHATARDQAEYVSEVFLGVRLRCANCHNHPLDRWTQDDYHGLAQIFARIDRQRVVRSTTSGEVTHPKTGQAAQPRIPGQRFLDNNNSSTELAKWLIADDNPYLARAMVGRIWQSLMGRGLVEPADDFRATNPASHPRLLDRLAKDFTENGYRVRNTIRLICNSAAYARSSVATDQSAVDDRFYSYALEKPLEAEVLADAMGDVLGIRRAYVAESPETRAIALVDPRIAADLDILGRCDRSGSCESSRGAGSRGVATKLHLLNGPLINQRLVSDEGLLWKLIAGKVPTADIITEYYLRGLCRRPTSAELEYWCGAIDRDSDPGLRRENLEDFVWSLLNCHDFVVNR